MSTHFWDSAEPRLTSTVCSLFGCNDTKAVGQHLFAPRMCLAVPANVSGVARRKRTPTLAYNAT